MWRPGGIGMCSAAASGLVIHFRDSGCGMLTAASSRARQFALWQQGPGLCSATPIAHPPGPLSATSRGTAESPVSDRAGAGAGAGAGGRPRAAWAMPGASSSGFRRRKPGPLAFCPPASFLFGVLAWDLWHCRWLWEVRMRSDMAGAVSSHCVGDSRE